MTYVLDAFIARYPVLEQMAAPYQYGVIISLPQSMALLPCTNNFRSEMESGLVPVETTHPYQEFYWLSPRLQALGLTASANGPIAYVEAEFFGGIGTQASIVWHENKILMGPIFVGENERVKLKAKPINRALRLLGIKPGKHYDEFAALGLGRHRGTNSWVD